MKGISWLFVSVCSFTTYALSHNIGASVFSGAVVRYRAYTSKGLSTAQVAVLVALCSFTFGLGTAFLGGLVLVLEPQLLERVSSLLPTVLASPTTARLVGFGLLGFVASTSSARSCTSGRCISARSRSSIRAPTSWPAS